MHPRLAYAQIRQVLLGFGMQDSLESTRSPDLQVWRCYFLLQNQLSRATSISFGDDVLGSGLALQDTLQKRLAQNFDPKRFKILPLHSQVRLVLEAVPWLVGINFGSHQTLNAHNRSGQQGSTILHFCTCYRLPISQKDPQTEFEVMLFPFFVKKGRISGFLHFPVMLLLLRRWPLNNSKKSLNQRHRECGRSCWPPTLPRYQGPHIQQRLHSVRGRLYPLSLFFWPVKSLVRIS